MLRALAIVVARLPWRWLSALGAVLGFVVGTVLRYRRVHVDEAMRRADLGGPVRSYAALGRSLLELFWLAGARSEARAREAKAIVDPASLAILDRALADGPVVLFASHSGNWELAAFTAARALAERGRRLAIVAKPLSWGAADTFMRRVRQGFGLVLLPTRGAVRAVLDALRRGDVVAMPIDQVPDRKAHALTLPFLGELALVDRAPATLALRANATALVVAAARDGEGTLRIEVVATIPAGTSALASTARATAALAAFVEAHPHEWLWLHRRWRSAPRRTGLSPALGPAKSGQCPT